MSDEERKALQDQAVGLLADGKLSLTAIYIQLDISQRLLFEWRKDPVFAARVVAAREEKRAAARDRAIAAVEFRVEQLNDVWVRLQRVIQERSLDPSMEKVPGGKTGLLSLDFKQIGEQIVPIYRVDGVVIKELREHGKQAAIELKQWSDKVEVGPMSVVDAWAEAARLASETTGDQESPGDPPS